MKNLIKEAQKRRFRISPIRWLGKTRLKSRSPEVYGKAIELVDKTDELLRELVGQQKIYVKELKKYAKGLSVINFSNSAHRFIRNQIAINKAIDKLKALFKQISGKWANIDMAINADIGRTPETEFEPDDSGYIEEQLQRISYVYNDLCKEALFGGNYWRSRTTSGRKFANTFKIVLNKLLTVYNKNLNILKTLDDIRSVGDPGEYLRVASAITGFDKMQDVLEKGDATFQTAWENFKKPEIQPEQKETPVEVQKEIEPATAPTVPVIITPEMLPEIPKEEPVIELPKESVEIPAEELQPETIEPEKKKLEEGISKETIAHEDFINKITKMANENCSEVEIAVEMLNYANEIDASDNDYAMKLTAIAEDIIE